MDELSPWAEAKNMELVATRGEEGQGSGRSFRRPVGGNGAGRTLPRRLLGPQTCELAVWGPHKSPAQRVLWGEEEQGSARSFHRQVETEGSGLCADEVRCRGPQTLSPERLCLFGEIS